MQVIPVHVKQKRATESVDLLLYSLSTEKCLLVRHSEKSSLSPEA